MINESNAKSKFENLSSCDDIYQTISSMVVLSRCLIETGKLIYQKTPERGVRKIIGFAMI